MRRIYQYYPQPHVAKTTGVESLAGATRFFTLSQDPPMYLGLGADKTCSTCLVEYASLFAFNADTLQEKEVVTLEYRMGDLLDFNYDPASRTLSYTMVVDDLNEDWARTLPKKKFRDMDIELDESYEGMEPEGDAEVVTAAYVFDGKRFVKKE